MISFRGVLRKNYVIRLWLSLLFWISIYHATHAQQCAGNPYTTNYFFYFMDSNEGFVDSIICDLSFWLWTDVQANIGISSSVPASFQPSGITSFLSFGAIFQDDEYLDSRYINNPTTGLGGSISRYIDYESVVFGYGGVTVDFLNFTLDDKLKLGTWKNKNSGNDWLYDQQSEHEFWTESRVALQTLSMGVNLCALKLGAVGGLFRLSACYVPSAALAIIEEEGTDGGGIQFMEFDRVTVEAGMGLSMDLWLFGGSTLGLSYSNSVYRFPNIPKSSCPSCPDTTFLMTQISRFTIVSRTLFSN